MDYAKKKRTEKEIRCPYCRMRWIGRCDHEKINILLDQVGGSA